MAVDSLRETRHINRIRAQDLSELWTAQSYRPDITSALAAVRRMPSWLPLSRMCRHPIAQGRTPVYATDGDGYACLKTRHVNGLIVDDTDPDWVTQECALSHSRFKVAHSTVLMNRSGAGSIGRCSVYLGNSAPLTNEHVLQIRIAAPHDPCFVAAYLSSWWGERAIEQGVTGSTGQLNLANEHVSRVPVPALSPDVQRYIGDKIRQAKCLRERARTLEDFARLLAAVLFERLVDEQRVLALLQRGPHDKGLRAFAEAATVRPRLPSIDAHRETKHTNYVVPTALTSLWTAPSYRPEITDALKFVRSGSWQPLGALCRESIVQGRTPTYATDGVGYPCLKTRHVSGLFVDDNEPDLVTFECAQELARFKVEADTILMNRSGAGSVGRCAVYLSRGAPLTNEHLLHIKLDPQHDACFITLFLSSWWGERAIEQGVTGSTGQLNLANEHVSRIPVPMVHRDVQSGVGNLLRKASECATQARALVASAKLLVECLIDGSISELDMVAAQKAIDAGDRGADRAILHSLRQNHDSPIFTDLDGLYALLDVSDRESD